MNLDHDTFSGKLKTVKTETVYLAQEMNDTQNELNELTASVNALLRKQGLAEVPTLDTSWLPAFQAEMMRRIEAPDILKDVKRLPELHLQDIVACSVFGLLAAMVDIFLVGTPKLQGDEVVGAPIQQWLRKIDGNSGIFKWFSEHCKLPYDISAVKDTVCPINHRLRSLAHDPLFGALFALLDICMGTTTCINNEGQLVMLIAPTGPAREKAPLFLLYYLGHLLSDAFTSCGLPVPGWFMTQFFASDSEDSLAKAAAQMYKEGFDARQYAAMNVSKQLGATLTELYLILAYPKGPALSGIDGELQMQRRQMFRTELRLLTSGVASAGNVLKILLPPDSGNLSGINLAQWQEFAWQGLHLVRAATRDMSVEIIVENRKELDKMWAYLQDDLYPIPTDPITA